MSVLTSTPTDFGIRSISQFAQRSALLREQAYVLADWVPCGSVNILVGDSGLGKSPLLYQLAMCVASGRPFLGLRTIKGKVIYFDYENAVPQVEKMVRALAENIGVVKRDYENGLGLWNRNDCPPGVNISRQLVEIVESESPSLVVIDSLSAFWPRAEDTNSETSHMIQFLRGLSNLNCAVILVHHRRKPDIEASTPPVPEPDTVRAWFNETRGAGALISSVDTRIGVGVSGDVDLTMFGFARSVGQLTAIDIRRTYDEQGEPLGYIKLTGLERLPDFQKRAYAALPKEFLHREAKGIYGKGPQATTNFLQKCIGLSLLTHDRRLAVYRKVDNGELGEV